MDIDFIIIRFYCIVLRILAYLKQADISVILITENLAPKNNVNFASTSSGFLVKNIMIYAMLIEITLESLQICILLV